MILFGFYGGVFMIRGVYFEIPQTVGITLLDILCDSNIDDYYWYVSLNQTEVWNKSLNNDFFDKAVYCGSDFLKLIQSEQYIIFLKLHGYPNKTSFENITTYEEFLNSDCEFILLIHDCEFIEFYSKSKEMIDTVYATAEKHEYKNIKYITDENDSRTKMNIL